jgi:hypothetical protein
MVACGSAGRCSSDTGESLGAPQCRAGSGVAWVAWVGMVGRRYTSVRPWSLRRLEEGDHSAFDPDLHPTDIIHRRIVGYHALHKAAQARGLGQMPLLSSNHDQWNRTIVKALTPQGRADILYVILQDLITAARDAGLDE